MKGWQWLDVRSRGKWCDVGQLLLLLLLLLLAAHQELVAQVLLNFALHRWRCGFGGENGRVGCGYLHGRLLLFGRLDGVNVALKLVDLTLVLHYLCVFLVIVGGCSGAVVD